MEKFYKSLLESMPYPLWVKDLEGRFIFINELFMGLYHLQVHDIIGKTNEDVFIPEIAKIYNKHEESFMETLTTQKFDGNIDNEFRECLMYPVVDADNEVVAIAGIINNANEENNMKQQLDYSSRKDRLTGLYNRSYFEEIMNELHNELHLPISIIMCDINGLRLINSTFGQAEGDKLIQLLARILETSCKGIGYVFRWGGDEFIISLPNCDERLCEKITEKIIEAYNSANHGLLELSLSVGSATTNLLDQPIYEVIKEAENNLFRQKFLQEKSVRGSIMFSLQSSLEAKNVETEKHTERMIHYSVALGKLLDFKISELDELVLVTRLHDIGKIGISENILLKPERLTDEEFEVMKTHTQKGLKIVEVSNELTRIGRGILTHHERWDGKGYPLGLKGEEIPLVSRIVSVVDSYDAMTNDRVYRNAITKEEAIDELKRCAGYQFDAKIVELFIKLIEKE